VKNSVNNSILVRAFMSLISSLDQGLIHTSKGCHLCLWIISQHMALDIQLTVMVPYRNKGQGNGLIFRQRLLLVQRYSEYQVERYDKASLHLPTAVHVHDHDGQT